MNHILQERQRLMNGIHGCYNQTVTTGENLEKGGKHGMIGEIRNGYKKVAEGKWKRVSEYGMTKEEHAKKGNDLAQRRSNIKAKMYYNEDLPIHDDEAADRLSSELGLEEETHWKIHNQLDDKEYSDSHVLGFQVKKSQPQFIIIGHGESGIKALQAIQNSLKKSQSEEALSIFVDNNIDESKYQTPFAIDSIVLKGFSVEQLLIIKEDTKGKLEKSYIPELIDLIKADDSVIEEKYKKKIAALKERRDPEGIEKSDEEKKESKEFQGLEDEGVVSDEDEDNVEKGGEGSRGGKVIGHTKSGKPIYMDDSKEGVGHLTKDFTVDDHIDAYEVHNHLAHENWKKEKESYSKGISLPTRGAIHNGDALQHLSMAKRKAKREYGFLDTKNIVKYRDGISNHHNSNKENGQDYHDSLVAGLKRSLHGKEIKKSFTQLEQEHTINNIQQLYSDQIEKGGKRAHVGEVRVWGGKKMVKHQDGWVYFDTSGNGKHTFEDKSGKVTAANDDHISHAKSHLDRHERETGGDKKEQLEAWKKRYNESTGDDKELAKKWIESLGGEAEESSTSISEKVKKLHIDDIRRGIGKFIGTGNFRIHTPIEHIKDGGAIVRTTTEDGDMTFGLDKDGKVQTSGMTTKVKKLEKSQNLSLPRDAKKKDSSDLEKAFSILSESSFSNQIEKGGKRATIGEVRTWGGEKWVKHQDGWVHVHPTTSKATLEKPGGKRETASEDHVNHYKKVFDEHKGMDTEEKKHADMVKHTHENMSDEAFKDSFGITKEESKKLIKEKNSKLHDYVFSEQKTSVDSTKEEGNEVKENQIDYSNEPDPIHEPESYHTFLQTIVDKLNDSKLIPSTLGKITNIKAKISNGDAFYNYSSPMVDYPKITIRGNYILKKPFKQSKEVAAHVATILHGEIITSDFTSNSLEVCLKLGKELNLPVFDVNTSNGKAYHHLPDGTKHELDDEGKIKKSEIEQHQDLQKARIASIYK